METMWKIWKKLHFCWNKSTTASGFTKRRKRGTYSLITDLILCDKRTRISLMEFFVRSLENANMNQDCFVKCFISHTCNWLKEKNTLTFTLFKMSSSIIIIIIVTTIIIIMITRHYIGKPKHTRWNNDHVIFSRELFLVFIIYIHADMHMQNW